MRTTTNLCLRYFFRGHLFPSVVYRDMLEIKIQTLYITLIVAGCLGKNNERTLTGTAKRWPRPINGGGKILGSHYTSFLCNYCLHSTCTPHSSTCVCCNFDRILSKHGKVDQGYRGSRCVDRQVACIW